MLITVAMSSQRLQRRNKTRNTMKTTESITSIRVTPPDASNHYMMVPAKNRSITASVTAWEMVLYHAPTADKMKQKISNVMQQAPSEEVQDVECNSSEVSPRDSAEIDVDNRMQFPSSMAWKMIRWIGKSKYNVAKRFRYCIIKEQVEEIIIESGIITRMKEAPDAPLSKQGNVEVYEPYNIQQREMLSRSPRIASAISMWWTSMNKKMSQKQELVLVKDTYRIMLYVLYSILLPVANTGNVWDVDYYRKIADADWLSDCRGHTSINKDRFHIAIFELADLWCETCEEIEYITFIRSITRKLWEQSITLGVHGLLFSKDNIEVPTDIIIQLENSKVKSGTVKKLIEQEKQSGPFIDEDGFVFQSKFEKRLLGQAYFNHADWNKSQCTITVDVSDLLDQVNARPKYDPVEEYIKLKSLTPEQELEEGKKLFAERQVKSRGEKKLVLPSISRPGTRATPQRRKSAGDIRTPVSTATILPISRKAERQALPMKQSSINVSAQLSGLQLAGASLAPPSQQRRRSNSITVIGRKP
jgi:hypothetical protein